MKKELYQRELDEWAIPIIRAVVRTYWWLHQSRFDRDELFNAAFVFYRERIRKLKHIDKGLLIHITKSYLHTYVIVNNFPIKVPGGTLTKKDGIKKAREILAYLYDKDLFFDKERTMAKDFKIDYENLISALPETDKVVLVSMRLGDNRFETEAILKGFKVRNPRSVMNKAVEKIMRAFTESGYP